jgi:hypothetical protein
MSEEIVWDELDERYFESGVSKGVLYDGVDGAYIDGVAWNGLTAVNQSPTGGESNKKYADNIVYVNLMSKEEFAASIEAFMAPRKFDKYNGIHTYASGLRIGQQSRGTFGFCWRTEKGTAENEEAGHVLHFAYGCKASPSERNDTTQNETPEPSTFTWNLSTTPVAVPGFKPIAYASIDTTDPSVDLGNLADLELVLYGNGLNKPRLPLPAEINTIMGAGILTDTPVEPAFDGIDEITIPVDVGTDYYRDGELLPDGALTITEDTIIEARPAPGYTFTGVYVTQWLYQIP